ncbi:hypothetical protein NBM05_01890 [Rothia sp. AR01]|uniref:Uncharacterized protein n=1 Tax=Rothia santali TaxID=2949643 RepID=A0A9X2HIB6_9MICC|nr:hypothetical protein [Rothia santali]MCP3424813.1 hypothetical protein [Rothia santali]
MNKSRNVSTRWNLPSLVLRPLVVLNAGLLALMLGLLIWGTVDGWIFEASGTGAGRRMRLEQVSLVAVFLSVGIVWAMGRPGAARTRRAAKRSAWWDRVHSAIRLAASNGDGGRKSIGLHLLEQLIEDPDGTMQDRRMLREVTVTLKAQG